MRIHFLQDSSSSPNTCNVALQSISGSALCCEAEDTEHDVPAMFGYTLSKTIVLKNRRYMCIQALFNASENNTKCTEDNILANDCLLW